MGKERNKYNLITGKQTYLKCTKCSTIYSYLKKKRFKAWQSLAISSFVFHSVCDTVLTDYSGVIESPNFPNPYPHNRNCTWVIQATLGNTLNVSFSHFQVETHTSCNYDHLQVSLGSLNIVSSYCPESSKLFPDGREFFKDCLKQLKSSQLRPKVNKDISIKMVFFDLESLSLYIFIIFNS